MDPQVLFTERLKLAPPTPADSEAVFEACQDPEIPRFVPIPSPYDRDHALGFIHHSEAAWASGSETTWAIHHPDDGLVGMVGLHINGKAAEIGFWVAASARGRGYATEAASTVLDYSFSAGGLGLRRIEWRARVGNLVSARIAQRLGFRYEGQLRQAMITPRGCYDAWVAGLLDDDERISQQWAPLA